MSTHTENPTARLAGKAGWLVGNVKVEASYAPQTNRPPNGLISDFGYGSAPRGFQAADYESRLEAERIAKVRAEQRLRAARLRGATEGELLRREDIIERDQRTCHLCGRTDLADNEIHLDHVIPLSKRGTHTADNVKVACAPCNLSKGSKLLQAA